MSEFEEIENWGRDSEESAPKKVKSTAVKKTKADGAANSPTPVLKNKGLLIGLAFLTAILLFGGIFLLSRDDDSIATDNTDDTSESDKDSGADGNKTSDDTEKAEEAVTLQKKIDEIIAISPIIFESSTTDISERHKRILNKVAVAMKDHTGAEVEVIGFTDGGGSDQTNEQLSKKRAENVKTYLVDKGIAGDALTVKASGETNASGSDALAGLERRVEFRVVNPGSAAVTSNGDTLKIAIVAPSAKDDVAFTQSMVDAVDVINSERGNIEIDITDNTFIESEAEAAIREYAASNYDLIIAHGSQYGKFLKGVAQEYPDVAFAWGTADETFGLPNVYSYTAAAEEGGYVLGTMASMLSQSDTIGVVGPLPVGDAKLYIDGFSAGAKAESPNSDVNITYIESFSDTEEASIAAAEHVADGADVLTGSAQMVVGAIDIAKENNTLWFGTQSNQTSLAPKLVVASQVYHWEVILEQVIADIDSDSLAGKSFTANLANGGLEIEYNGSYALASNVRSRGDAVTAGIKDKSITVPKG